MNNSANNKELKPPLKRNILLDTCFLRYLNNKDIAAELIKYFLELINRGFEFAISEISIYEFLSGNSVRREKERIALLGLFKTFQITTNVLVAAAQLTTLYQNENIPQENSISLQDKIIGSTCILTGSIILTADTNDFPRPFFSEAEKRYVLYTKNSKQEMLVLQLLQADYIVINTRFKDRPY